jgi:hypothetical protein
VLFWKGFCYVKNESLPIVTRVSFLGTSFVYRLQLNTIVMSRSVGKFFLEKFNWGFDFVFKKIKHSCVLIQSKLHMVLINKEIMSIAKNILRKPTWMLDHNFSTWFFTLKFVGGFLWCLLNYDSGDKKKSRKFVISENCC